MKTPHHYYRFFVHAKKVVRFAWSHPANEGKRASALLRLASFQFRGRVLRRRTLARIGDQSLLWAYLHRFSTLTVICANPPDYPEMITWQRALHEGDLFIDVGANAGVYTIWAAELGAEVVALEPAEDTFALLQENIDLNGYPVTPIRAAAGRSCGTTRFTSGRDAVNRMDPDGTVTVETVTIDSIIKDRLVSGMKIDVEGFEIDVLNGCRDALAGHRIELIQLEWNATCVSAVGTDRQPVADLLTGYGYTLHRPDSSGNLMPLADLSYGLDVFARAPRPEAQR